MIIHLKGDAMRSIINCINLRGASIPALISEHLAIESIQLYRSADSKRILKGNTYAGLIKTDRESVRFFGLHGISFDAEIEYEAPDKTSRKVSLHFIIEPSILSMDFADGYDFVIDDLPDPVSIIKGFVDEIIKRKMSNSECDNIGQTAGTC
jgi:hypothetical protein